MAGGRPSKYSQEMLETALDYIQNYSDYGDAIPMACGLAVALDVSKKTLYNWAEAEENQEFLHALEKLKTFQERSIINGSILGDFNAPISKLMLTNNHEYQEKPETNNADEETPPLNITFNVKEPAANIKVTNAKP